MNRTIPLSLARFGAIACAIAVFGQAPMVDIDIHKNRNLWRAQRNVAIAYESIQEAQKSNSRDPGGHAQKAQDLLIQVNKELKLAATSLDRP